MAGLAADLHGEIGGGGVEVVDTLGSNANEASHPDAQGDRCALQGGPKETGEGSWRPGNGQTKRWANLFTTNRVSESVMSLQLVEQEGDDALTVEEVVGFYLVGRFLGRFLS